MVKHCCLQKKLIVETADLLVRVLDRDPHKRANLESIGFTAMAHAKDCNQPECEICKKFLKRLKEAE